MVHEDETLEREVAPAEVDAATAGLVAAAEINQQIATAKRYPRSIKKFIDLATELATLNDDVAKECIYALPRKERDDQGNYVTKVIEGPSARFAEILGSAWGNAHAATRVVSDQGDFIVAQGVFWDLERNWKVMREVQRRITTKSGQRFSADMVGVTGNAASSIALRNAILAGVPKALWQQVFARARHVVMGDFKTLAKRRDDAFASFVSYGLDKAQVCHIIGVAGPQDVGLEQLTTLVGLLTALKDGSTTAEQLLAEKTSKPPVNEPQSKSSKGKATKAKKDKPRAPAPEPELAATLPGGSVTSAAHPEPAPPSGPTVSADAAKMLRQNLASAKVPEKEFCHYFGIEKLEDLPSGKVKDGISWLVQQRQEQGG